MRRTIPLWITAATGFVLIAAYFSPYTESWGEKAMIWFDILASIAFILGGGNLLKVHLKKIVDRAAGWAYSAITVLAFLVTLYVGLAKWGVPPAEKQEYYGEAFARLPLEDFPRTYSVEGEIPAPTAETPLPASAAWQIRQEDGHIVFRGWMLPNQKADLEDFQQQLRWQCTVERLYDKAQPPEELRGKAAYYADHEALAFQGHMTEADRSALAQLGQGPAWQRAVDELFDNTQEIAEVEVGFVPARFSEATAKAIGPDIHFDPQRKVLAIQGPMSSAQRRALERQFPVARPLPEGSPGRLALLEGLTSRGPLDPAQTEALAKELDTVWSVGQLRETLDQAVQAEEVDKTACEMLAEQQRGVAAINPKKKVGRDEKLRDAQVALLGEFVAADWTVAELVRRLRDAGPFTSRQESALEGFFRKVPTEPELKKQLAMALWRAGPLTARQETFLLADYRDRLAWQRSVARLFVLAHRVKFPWSGEYNAQGSPFWWLYEYAFKPLTATMFAMLAFFVASAAFRAFRAKNLEATLLLATAFIILLGRTFAGVVATEWLPGWLSGLRIDNLTVTIMAVFNTAGSRAIVIGIALGIASTSLKVLLGIDRSYLGTGGD